MTLHDKFGRQITDLRISITDRCNFRCVYCRSADPENYRDHDEILSWPELDRLARVFLNLGIRKIRIMTNNPKKIYGIDGFGLTVVEEVPIRIEPGEHNRTYLSTKKAKLGHKL